MSVEAEIADIKRRLKELEGRENPEYTPPTAYTPTYLGGTTPGVTTYLTQAGFYARIGQVIFFNGRVQWSAATGTGAVNISLPFTSRNTAGMRYSVFVWVDTVTFANGSVEGQIAPNVSFFDIRSPITNAGSTIVNVEAAGDIIFSGFYYV